MYKKILNSSTSCKMEFEIECIKCKNINTNTFGVECTHTKNDHHVTHVFTQIQPSVYSSYRDSEGDSLEAYELFHSKFCHVQSNCISEIIFKQPLVTKITILCTHPIGEDHVTHEFNVPDVAEYDWKSCNCI